MENRVTVLGVKIWQKKYINYDNISIATNCVKHKLLPFYKVLEDTARYVGLLLAPAEGFGGGQGFFCPSGKKIIFYDVFAFFRPFLGFSSNLINFQ